MKKEMAETRRWNEGEKQRAVSGSEWDKSSIDSQVSGES